MDLLNFKKSFCKAFCGCDDSQPAPSPTPAPTDPKKPYDDTVGVMPSDNRIVRVFKYLHPALRSRLENALDECHSNGLMVFVFESYRSPERQQYLYDQGRTRKGPVVTNAKPLQSWHNYGLAIDLVFDGDKEKDGIQWTWKGDYTSVGKIMQKHGFEWGRFFKSIVDDAHFQIAHDLTISKARDLYQSQGGLQAVWDYITEKDTSQQNVV